jgi:hypothetical protein
LDLVEPVELVLPVRLALVRLVVAEVDTVNSPIHPAP